MLRKEQDERRKGNGSHPKRKLRPDIRQTKPLVYRATHPANENPRSLPPPLLIRRRPRIPLPPILPLPPTLPRIPLPTPIPIIPRNSRHRRRRPRPIPPPPLPPLLKPPLIPPHIPILRSRRPALIQPIPQIPPGTRGAPSHGTAAPPPLVVPVPIPIPIPISASAVSNVAIVVPVGAAWGRGAAARGARAAGAAGRGGAPGGGVAVVAPDGGGGFLGPL